MAAQTVAVVCLSTSTIVAVIGLPTSAATPGILKEHHLTLWNIFSQMGMCVFIIWYEKEIDKCYHLMLLTSLPTCLAEPRRSATLTNESRI